MRPLGAPPLLVLRRRGRSVLFCVVLLVIVSLTLFSGHGSPATYLSRPTSARDDRNRLSRYLEVATAWKKPRPTQDVFDAHPAAAETDIDLLPEIPPTLQTEDDELDFDEDDAFDDSFEDQSGGGLPAHDWRRDGLLTVNPDGAHPIYELIRHAELRWEAKQRRASKTLREAVREYRRRYKRLPPKGFDHWWDYVQKHNVQLPDEYDQIYRDLEPYWGIDPRDLRVAQAEWEAHPDSYTIGKISEDSVVTVLNMSMPEDRKTDFLNWGAKPQMDLLNEIYKFIPTFRATFSPHDSPNQFADWTWRNAAVKAAKEDVYIKPGELPPIDRLGWSAGCPHDSPLYLNPPEVGQEPTPQTSKTFIHDHRATMDPCYHPQHIVTHGSFLFLDVDPVPSRFTAPQLSNCATSLHIDIHATSMSQSSEFVEDDPEWEDKEDDRLLWRGSPTGMWHRDGLSWRACQRVRLVNLTGPVSPDDPAAKTDPDYLYTYYLRPGRPANGPVGEPVQRDRQSLNDALVDIGFTGDVSGCEPPVCEVMQQELTWKSYMDTSPRGAGRYKYHIDIDGNGWSSRFRRLMSTHSLVFKATVFPEWWTDRVQAWVHYVPVQIDYSDLFDALVFFGGDLSGKGAHEEMARKIAYVGRDWTSRYWRKEDVTAYMFRLWLEYARVMSLDRDSMAYHLPRQG
ncbi:hypothetical protein M0805_005937 [Coniferiporia weirii]|nr:hypothetical protein M0805_005937 [Coniferiporia weirii]